MTHYLPVEQVDRDAAAKLMRQYGHAIEAMNAGLGNMDTGLVVQVFVAHRYLEREQIVAWLRGEWLTSTPQECAGAIECGEHDVSGAPA